MKIKSKEQMLCNVSELEIDEDVNIEIGEKIVNRLINSSNLNCVETEKEKVVYILIKEMLKDVSFYNYFDNSLQDSKNDDLFYSKMCDFIWNTKNCQADYNSVIINNLDIIFNNLNKEDLELLRDNLLQLFDFNNECFAINLLIFKDKILKNKEIIKQSALLFTV